MIEEEESHVEVGKVGMYGNGKFHRFNITALFQSGFFWFIFVIVWLHWRDVGGDFLWCFKNRFRQDDLSEF